MPRIKLSRLEKYTFVYHRELKVGDINYGGHLGNDSVVRIVHEARLDLLRSMGLSELDLGDSKTGIIMTDLAVNFKGEGFLFDKITIHSRISEIVSTGFRVFHYFTKDSKPVALAETGLASFDYQSRKIVPLPEAFLKAVELAQKD